MVQTLSKKYEVSPDLLDDKAPALSECSGTDIAWKAGKNLTVTETVKKQKAKAGKNKGQVKTVVTSAPKPSFFNYFAMPMTEEEEAEFEEQEDEEAVRVKLTMEEGMQSIYIASFRPSGKHLRFVNIAPLTLKFKLFMPCTSFITKLFIVWFHCLTIYCLPF